MAHRLRAQRVMADSERAGVPDLNTDSPRRPPARSGTGARTRTACEDQHGPVKTTYLPLLLLASCKGTTAPPEPPSAPEDRIHEPAIEAPDEAAVTLTRGDGKEGFRRSDSGDAPLLRVSVIEPAGSNAQGLAKRFVATIPAVYACYERSPSKDRAWLSVEIGHYGDPASVRVQLGPTEPTEELRACAEEAVAELQVEDGSAHGLFSVEIYETASRAPELPTPQPDDRVELRYGAGCYRWIEEPPCPPRKRCYVDRWELCACR